MSGTDKAGGDRFDAIVIGSGSAGSAFSKRAAANGARVAMVEMAELGGVCVNRGCVPKKLMWHSAHERREANGLAASGYIREPSELDYGLLHRRIGEHVSSIRHSFAEAMDDCGVTVISGKAELSDDGVRVGDRTLRADRVIIACGGRPTAMDIPGWDLCDTSDGVFGWTERPERILIIGGGYIGVEFATVFSGLGSTVTIADEGKHLLDGFDPDAVALAEKHLREGGVTLMLPAELREVERSGSALLAHLSDGGTVECDRVVVAIGRTPRIDELGPAAQSLDVAKNGSLEVSDTFETSHAGWHAIGDAANRMPLTPVARRDGEWLADHLFGDEAGERLDLSLVATATYCDPPLAQVGVTDNDEHDLHVEKGDLDPLRNGLFERSGARATYLHKTLSEGPDGRLRGMALVSRTAPDEISYVATLLAVGADRAALDRPGSVHPTFAEEFIG